MEVDIAYFESNFEKLSIEIKKIKRHFWNRYVILCLNDSEFLINCKMQKSYSDLKKYYSRILKNYKNFEISKDHQNNLDRILSLGKINYQNGDEAIMAITFKFIFKTKTYTKLKETEESDPKDNSQANGESLKDEIYSRDSHTSSVREIHQLGQSERDSEFNNSRNEIKDGETRSENEGEERVSRRSKFAEQANFKDDYRRTKFTHLKEKRNSLDKFDRRSSRLEARLNSNDKAENSGRRPTKSREITKYCSLQINRETQDLLKNSKLFPRQHQLGEDEAGGSEAERGSSRANSEQSERFLETYKQSTLTTQSQSGRSETRSNSQSQWSKVSWMQRKASIIEDELMDPNLVFKGKWS